VLPGQRITIDAKATHQQAQQVTVLLQQAGRLRERPGRGRLRAGRRARDAANQWREDRSGIRFLRDHLRGLAPAGRLDIDSVGLLVLTQDGRIARQLIGEDSDVEKEYLVRVQVADGGALSAEGLALLNHGLSLDGEALRPAQVEWVNDDQLRFVLKEGKKRQIRRMCEAVGLKVLGLKRVRIGGVMLGDLPPGHWRYLRGDERFA
jgi:23S rRNA pseudouridine2604 synthase